MNKARLREFRDRFRDKVPEEKFRMDMWAAIPSGKADKWGDEIVEGISPARLGECGTVGCLAGWVCHLFDVGVKTTAELDAQEFLELADCESDYLFWGNWGKGKGLKDLTKQEALDELNRMLEED